MPEIILFKSPTCGPCRTFLPVVAEVVGELPLRVMDVSRTPEAVAQYDITAVPTLIIEKDGEEVYRLMGATEKSELANILQSFAS